MWKVAAAMLGMSSCAVRYHQLEPLTPDQLHSPLPVQHVQVDGVDVAYVDTGGDKPPLVLVHGLSSYLTYWEHQLGPLAETHRVLALDLPGYGRSGRPDAPYTPPYYAGVVAGFLDALGVASAPVVGHSMGGQIALTLALDHPERVDALVLSAPAGFEGFQPGHARFMKEYWHEGRALEATEQQLRATFEHMVFNRPDEGVERLLEERVRLQSTPAFRATSVAVSRSIAGMLDHPVRDRLGELDLPVLIVFGTADHMIPNPVFNGGRTATIARHGQAAIRGAELVLLKGAGHTVHHDDPEAFNAAVSEFLTRLPAPTAVPWDAAAAEGAP